MPAVSARPSAAPDVFDLTSRARFNNRELSWLAFNERVLEESENPSNPLLERLRFLSIAASNSDEFTMVRIAGLKGQVAAGVTTPSEDGMTPREQLAAITVKIRELADKQTESLAGVGAAPRENCISVCGTDELPTHDRDWLRAQFIDQIFPMLTPMAIDPSHPFPFIPNFGFGLILELSRATDARNITALVPIPQQLDRFILLPGSNDRYVAMEDVILLSLDLLFPKFRMDAKGTFRVIRDSEIEIDEEAEDLVRQFESALRERRRGHVVQLRVDKDMPHSLQHYLSQAMQVEDDDVLVLNGLVGLVDIKQLINNTHKHLLFPPYEPRFPERVRDYGGDCFAAIRAKDILVHHPYESFDVVVQFLRQAAADPQVVAIKQTLYRTTQNSPIVAALKEAAENGKSVTRLSRAESPVRRSQQHTAGPRYGTGWCTGRLWIHHIEDARQTIAGGSARGRAVTELWPLWHRQLSSDHSANLHRPFVFHHRPGAVSRYGPALQLYHRLRIAGLTGKGGSFNQYRSAKKLLDLIDAEIEHAKAGKPGCNMGQNELHR